MPLARPLADWPDLLCGPILRRVTPRSVAVWAVFKRSGEVTLVVSHKSEAAGAWSAATDTLALGLNLHLALLELVIGDSQPALAPNHIYQYELRFKPTGASGTQSLKDLGVLGGPTPLGYEVDELPTFALPPQIQDLRVVYGSCRKPHGPGPDALALLDGIIAATRGNALERPHQLLLGGDQIYADDVSLALLLSLTATAATLLAGWSHLEQLPVSTDLGWLDWTSSELTPGGRREAFLRAHTGLTSEELQGHLLFLGEFVAMYLFAWSDALWPRRPDGVITLPTVADLRGSGEQQRDTAPFGRRGSQTTARTFDEARSNALVFASTLKRVRRVLANVPSYMIFDDHEITDDWAIDRAWDLTMRRHAPTRHIVRNGLLAYAVFQDWGNHPERYERGPAKSLLDSLRFAPGQDPQFLARPDACDLALDLTPTRPLPDARMQWDFDVVGPGHVVIALDTRTHRDYSAANRGHAGLIGNVALRTQLEQRRAATGSRLPIIVSAAPIIGHPLIEAAQEIFVGLDIPLFHLIHHGRPVEHADFEAWSGHRPSFERFLQSVAAFGRAVVVSGDVHYAFANHLAYFPDGPSSSPSSRIVQLCSSAFKNQSAGTAFVSAIGHLGHETSSWLGFDESLTSDVQRDLRVSLIGQWTPALGMTVADMYHVIAAGQRLDRPAVIPAGPWPTDQSYQLVKALANSPLGEHPSRTNWRYTVTYLSDTRFAEVRLQAAPALARALNLRRDHASRTLAVDHGRTVVGDNNLGAMRFEVDGFGHPKAVVNRLYWSAILHGDIGDIMVGSLVMFSEVRAPLTLPDPVTRPAVSR